MKEEIVVNPEKYPGLGAKDIDDGVWRLQKLLYGRQKAPRGWMEFIEGVLTR